MSRAADVVFGVLLLGVLAALLVTSLRQRPIFLELVAAVERVAQAEELRTTVITNQRRQLVILGVICRNTARTERDHRECRALDAAP